ncbi:glucosyltransferase domain-containing protein [Cronobacter sakazakii]|uniref:glucosyltransferase domain-containing protein n=1 Tax=Cronobacter sakazakii TaxID=28141 RepID=UPI000907560B|nr:glucosyltransferase domain-containing protein [Cronobacter sakazakii]DAE53832.1 MAG TPA: Glucosyl transferase GtrII [Caudoviricetes sp.]EGT5209109.1 hypothetical protein [Cronobacter sakazakii]EGT5755226.1 hypothetical protein [Cronobacter sakazakii]EJG0818478.1 glucosyltransferase domain-containing protein [Cronobacter sakazakii]EJG2181211.1 glucosyltransferase domain-containing protein [Cronobacter sakazakii]
MTRKQSSLAIIAIFFFPFILLDLKYYDDLSRINLGYFYWSPDGRPLSELIMKLLSFGGKLTDLYPYTYIASILLASYTVYKLAPKEYGISGIIISSLCFVTWNYIPNAAYRFDNLTMTLSLAMSIIAGTLNQSSRSFIFKTAFLVASLSLYQASFGAFLCVSICYVFLDIARGNCIEKNRYISIFLTSIISIFIYKLVIVGFFVSGEYAQKNGDIISTPIQFFYNIEKYISFISNNTPSFLFWIYISLFVICSMICVCVSFRSEIKSHDFLTRIFIAISPCLIFMSCPSFMLFFKNIPYAVRAYTSFGVSIASIILLFILSLTMLSKYFVNTYVKISAFFSFVYIIYVLTSISAFYNISSDMVDKYKSVAYTVAMYAKNDGSQCLSISGRMPQSSNELNAYEKYPFIKSISPQYADHYLSWIVFYINNYGYNMRSCEYPVWEDTQKKINSIPIKFSSTLFDIRSNNDVVNIDFKK